MFPKRSGFTVVEVIVALAIMSIALATVVMTTRGRLVENEASALVKSLEAYRVAVNNFRAHVGGWPGYARQLIYPPDAPAIPVNVKDDDLCEHAFTEADIALWRGPYLAQLFSVDGARVGNAVINNRFLRDPEGASVAGDLIISVSEVEEDVAKLVDELIDGKPANFAAGAVRYVAATESLTYRVPIGGC